MTGRVATLLTTLGAGTVLLSTIAAKPVPRYLWNASRSAPIGLYELQPNGRLAVTQLVAVQSPNLWQHSSQIAAICRAAFHC